MSKHEISIKEVKQKEQAGVTTFSRKNNSPRGIEIISASDVKVGDKIVIDNFFHTVVE